MPEKLEERIVPRSAMDRPSDEIQESVILRKVALPAPPVLVPALHRQHRGSDERRLREAADDGRPRAGREGLWSRRRAVLRRVHALRGAEQPDPAPDRGPPVDQPDHGELGNHLGLHDVRAGRMELLRCSAILLGIAEAGFFPGIILYMSYWFPERERARAVAWFMMASPLSGVVNGPISGALLEYTNTAWGLAGWQWLFLIEGIPAVILGFVTWSFLTDRPEDARWLEPGERAWLSARMAREEKTPRGPPRPEPPPGAGESAVRPADPALLHDRHGHQRLRILRPDDHRYAISPTGAPTRSACLYAIPSLFAAIGMVLFSRHSDRSGERRWHLAAASFLAAIGWVLSATVQSPWLALMALTLAFLGMMCMMGPYWSLATSFLSGTAAAGGIALINTIANAGGVLSPSLMGWMKTVTGTFTTGQVMLALTMLAGSGLALCIRHVPEAETAKTARCRIVVREVSVHLEEVRLEYRLQPDFPPESGLDMVLTNPQFLRLFSCLSCLSCSNLFPPQAFSLPDRSASLNPCGSWSVLRDFVD